MCVCAREFSCFQFKNRKSQLRINLSCGFRFQTSKVSCLTLGPRCLTLTQGEPHISCFSVDSLFVYVYLPAKRTKLKWEAFNSWVVLAHCWTSPATIHTKLRAGLQETATSHIFVPNTFCFSLNLTQNSQKMPNYTFIWELETAMFCRMPKSRREITENMMQPACNDSSCKVGMYFVVRSLPKKFPCDGGFRPVQEASFCMDFRTLCTNAGILDPSWTRDLFNQCPAVCMQHASRKKGINWSKNVSRKRINAETLICSKVSPWRAHHARKA